MKRLLQLTFTVSLAVAALSLCSCSSPLAGPDQFDIGLARAMTMQSEHAMQASQMMARTRAGLEPLAPLEPLRR